MADLLSITLPAGTYVLHGQVILTTPGRRRPAYQSQCLLGPMIAPIGLAQARLEGTASFADKATLPVTDVVELSTEETLTMRCSQTPGDCARRRGADGQRHRASHRAEGQRERRPVTAATVRTSGAR